MGLFRKATTANSLAVATLLIGAGGEFDLSWQGDLAFVLRIPAIYLDWALNKDQKRRAKEMLETLDVVFAGVSQEDPEIDLSRLVERGFRLHDVEVVVGITNKMRPNVSFRPRFAISTHLYLAFGGLWNGIIAQLARDGESEATTALLDDMREQLSIHKQIGLGMRGGLAPMAAGQRGAGSRLEREIADAAGLSVEEFRALSDEARDAVIYAHAEASLTALHTSDASARPAAGVSPGRDIDYWPTLDLDAIWARITATLREALVDRDEEQLYFPGWFVRRLVAVEVLNEAIGLRPEIADDFDFLASGEEDDLFREDRGVDEQLDAALTNHHLAQIVAALVHGLSTKED
ncbi:MAG: hypothetical protein IRZ20_07385 [Thermoleophilia bacterium]|nr:hypothetical protein [Thermoleophilia bacterium]